MHTHSHVYDDGGGGVGRQQNNVQGSRYSNCCDDRPTVRPSVVTQKKTKEIKMNAWMNE